ncbi:hypothetical protein [Amycolatopsis taiwanensis]|uniref:Uncharacterized protein n=1 Tax=Amycolatopsis taiwanensis TaxID=342230 RepID=A0A9W6R7U1_9PSEU|nr:hypothetical protein [Amycolatopsis taiwanensis]GLY70969.1 hypothetical protein Atai01_75880 [Amycolatopsis taiwanensis]
MTDSSPHTSRQLPLDEGYSEYLHDLNALMRDDPDLADIAAVRAFVEANKSRFGPRTARATLEADPDQLRMLVHVMVLAASELADLHEGSRNWLTAHGRTMPPWDATVPRTAQRLITFGNKVYGVVEWEPTSRVELNDDLDEPERRWATALAIGIGERPQWTNDEVSRYAAYLTLGTSSFADERPRSDEELAARHQVPVEAVRYRRELADVL